MSYTALIATVSLVIYLAVVLLIAKAFHTRQYPQHPCVNDDPTPTQSAFDTSNGDETHGPTEIEQRLTDDEEYVQLAILLRGPTGGLR